MYAAAAFVPIVFVIVLMAAFDCPARKAIPGAWLITSIIACAVWRLSPAGILRYTAAGFLESLTVLVIIFGAVLIMNTLTESTAMNSIKGMFNRISPDARVQMVLIAFLFGAFLEGAAGFGVPATIVGPLMVSVGFPAMAAASLALVFNTFPVCFGAVGTPTNTAIAVVSDAVTKAGADVEAFNRSFTAATALFLAVCAFFVLLIGMVLLVMFFGQTPEKRRLRHVAEIMPFVLYVTLLFDALYLLIAAFVGPELVSLVSSALSLLIVLFTSQKGFLMPKEAWTFVPDDAAAAYRSRYSFEPKVITLLYEKLQTRIQARFDALYDALRQEEEAERARMELEMDNYRRENGLPSLLDEEKRQLALLAREMDDYYREAGWRARLRRKGFVNGMPLLRAWTPYILIGLFLTFTRVLSTLSPESWAGSMKAFRLIIPDGNGGVFWSWAVLWSPGIIFILAAVLTVFLHRMRAVQVKKAWLRSFDQVRGAAIPLLFGVAMVYILRNSANPAVSVTYLMDGQTAPLGSMLTMMADGLGFVFRDNYLLISPVLGIVGAFVSGSNTVSNTLFAGLQFETATVVGLSHVILLTLQNCGGAIGNMICVNNVISASATTGVSGNEGRIIRMNALPCAILWLVLIVLALLVPLLFPSLIVLIG